MKNTIKSLTLILTIIMLQQTAANAQVKNSLTTKENTQIQTTHYNNTQVNGLKIFYREAGSKDAPTLLL